MFPPLCNRGETRTRATGGPVKVLKLIVPYPKLTGNKLWRHSNGRVIINEKGREYFTQVNALVRASGWLYGIEFPVEVNMQMTMPDERTRDLTNVAKVVEDALTKAGVWVDDSLIHRSVHERVGVDPKSPRVEISITAYRKGGSGGA